MFLLLPILHPGFITWKQSSLAVQVLDSSEWSLIHLQQCIQSVSFKSNERRQLVHLYHSLHPLCLPSSTLLIVFWFFCDHLHNLNLLKLLFLDPLT